jgi:cell division septum initiation protein DivIVA
VTDSGMRGRVKGLLGGPTPFVNDTLEPMDVSPNANDANAQHHALQVLTLAQRTGEEHIASARRESDRIIAEARAQAEQVMRDAQAHAQVLQKDAEKALADAHASAAQITEAAQAHSDAAQRSAEDVLGDARSRADELVKAAQANADELKHQAHQKYEDVVGSLAARREALQRQIEALEQFDQDYRARLTSFMQHQLRSLWVDEPRVDTGAIEGFEEYDEEDEQQPRAALEEATVAVPTQGSKSDLS